MLGQAAATAASLSIKDRESLHDLPYAKLKAQLVADGQVVMDARADKRKPKKPRVE